jgi:hypothetical protein
VADRPSPSGSLIEEESRCPDGCGGEHPSATSDGSNGLGSENAANSHEERVASSFSDLGQSDLARQLAPTDHPTIGFDQGPEDVTFLVRQ